MTKSKHLSKEKLETFDPQELQKYLDDLNAECKRLTTESEVAKKKVEEERLKTAKLRGELKVWRERNEKEKIRLGWQDISDEELDWLMYDGYEKYWKGEYFHTVPTASEIKAKFSEETGKDTLSKYKEKGDLKFEKRNGWIDRQGRFFGLELAEHERWAKEWLEETYGKEEAEKKLDKSPYSYAYEYLQGLGWVRILCWSGTKADFILPKKLRHAQKQTIFKYCKFNDKPIPFDDPLFKL